MRKSTVWIFLLLPLFIAGCTAGESSDCHTSGPNTKVIIADSLILIPFSYTHHYNEIGKRSIRTYRSLKLGLSKRDSSNAYVHLDSNRLGIFLNQKRFDIPASYTSGPHCPSYNEWSVLDVSGAGPDTAVLLEVRKDSIPVRSWVIAFSYDSTKAPAIRIDSISGGFRIEAQIQPDTRFDNLTFAEHVAGNWRQDLEMQQSGNVISASIAIKDLWGIQKKRYASEIAGGRFQVCLNSTAGIETLTINGVTSNLNAEFCQELQPKERDMIVRYLMSRCLDCE